MAHCLPHSRSRLAQTPTRRLGVHGAGRHSADLALAEVFCAFLRFSQSEVCSFLSVHFISFLYYFLSFMFLFLFYSLSVRPVFLAVNTPVFWCLAMMVASILEAMPAMCGVVKVGRME